MREGENRSEARIAVGWGGGCLGGSKGAVPVGGSAAC